MNHIPIVDSGALSSPILVEHDASGIFGGCFSVTPSLWPSFLVDFSSSTIVEKREMMVTKNLKTLGFGVCT